MKIVGIVGRVNKNSDNSNEFECLETYINIFTKYKDVVPIMILPTKDIIYNNYNSSDECVYDNLKLHKLDKVLDMCDGFLIPGGTKWFSHDEYIIKYAIEKDKPLLGICLGMQILGVMDNRLNSGIFDTTIKNETKINHCNKDIDYVHSVNIIKDTLLYKIINKDKIMVNSRHNYHIGEIINTKINAVSEDGLIEAISYPNKKFILGVQWHPENLMNKDINHKKIFDYFINSL